MAWLAADAGMHSEGGLVLLSPVTAMHLFLSAFEEVPDHCAKNAWHDLVELLVTAFVSALCPPTSCADMAALGRAKVIFL